MSAVSSGSCSGVAPLLWFH